MRRREFIAGLSTASALPLAWPGGSHAQQSMPVVGFLNSRPASQTTTSDAAFRQGLREVGYTEGTNVVIEARWAEGQFEKLPALAAELVTRQVNVIVCGGNTALAARAATRTIPIVFIGGSDPVTAGLVASINRPGGNVTGILNIASLLTAKRLELLRELAAGRATIAALHNPAHPESSHQVKEVRDAAQQLGLTVIFIAISRTNEIDAAFSEAAQKRAAALLLVNDPFLAGQRHRLAAQAARHKLPAIYAQREYADAGGLMSYGPNFADLYRQAGIYSGRILKGELPGELPVMQPTRFEFVINLKTAKTLGLELPAKLLALADEVIE